MVKVGVTYYSVKLKIKVVIGDYSFNHLKKIKTIIGQNPSYQLRFYDMKVRRIWEKNLGEFTLVWINRHLSK